MADSRASVLTDPLRLDAVRRTGLVEACREAPFDRLTRLAATAVGAPTALVSLVTDERLLFKGAHGLPAAMAGTREVPFCNAICHTVVATGEPLAVEDARADPRFAHIAGAHGIELAGYLGVPLRTSDGHAIGTLCVFDREPRRWSDDDVSVLRDVAESTMTEMELRRELRERSRGERALEAVAVGTADASSGHAFFRSLVGNLATALGVRFAFVARVLPDRRGRLLAFSADGVLMPESEYPLEGTPCDDVLHADLCYYPTDVKGLFPLDAYLAEHGVESYMGMPLRDERGTPIGTIGVMHGAPLARPDAAGALLRIFAARVVAEFHRMHADEELRQSREEWRLLSNSSPVGIFRANMQGEITYTNLRAEQIFGFGAGEGLGHAWTERLHPEDASRVLSGWAGALAGQVEYRDEFRLLLPGAQVRWAQCRSAPLRLAGDPRSRGMVGTVEDITERRALEEQLRQAAKMDAVGQLAGGMAHDFNNLLTVIRIHAEFLLDGIPHGDPAHADTMEIARAADRAAALTRQLLAFSRKQMLQPVVVDLDELVAGILPMVRRLIGEDVTVGYAPGAVSAPVLADPGQLEQVVVNLALNARDAMPHGGTLTFRIATTTVHEDDLPAVDGVRAGEYTTLTVEDSGAGMSGSTMARIFEPFYTTKAPGRGTGLGLSTVYGIIQQSGGAVGVTSAPGAGSRFVVYLPSVPAATCAASPSSPAERAPVAGTVLIVEDESSVRRLASRVLRSRGYSVLEAETGRQAIALIEAHAGALDLVLSDVVMPEMGGRALREWLAVERPGLPVLLMTGYTDDEIIRRGVEEHVGSGRLPLIEKPFTTESLAEAVGAVIAGG